MIIKNKTLEKIASAVFLIILIIAADRILTYMLEPMTRADYFRHDMEEMEKTGNYPDMIIVGNSRSVHGFNPLVFESDLGLNNVYNASVVGQQISSKYYIAEAMINAFHPKIVLFDTEWQSLNEFGDTRTQAKLLGLDRLTGISKIRYIFDAFSFSEMIYAFCKPYRFRDNLFHEGTVAGNLKLKNWLRDTHYSENYYSTIKGYDKGDACSAEPFRIGTYGTFNEDDISAKSKDYLDRIVKLCKDRNISLFLVTPPISTMMQMNIGNYEEANDYYLSYAEENGISYHNLNMLKNRDEIFNDSLFFHEGHLCESGATAASHIYAEIIQDELDGIDTKDRFYHSIDEMLSDISRIVAVGAEVKAENGTLIITDLKYSAGKDADIIFEIQLSSDGKNYETKAVVTPPDNSIDIPIGDVTGRIYVKIIADDTRGGSGTYAGYIVKAE